jgi:hypothetical protein
MTPETIIESDQDLFVTHTSIRKDVSLDELVKLLRERKATGEIRVLLNQGGKQQVLLVEHTKLSETERDSVRKLLKME